MGFLDALVRVVFGRVGHNLPANLPREIQESRDVLLPGDGNRSRLVGHMRGETPACPISCKKSFPARIFRTDGGEGRRRAVRGGGDVLQERRDHPLRPRHLAPVCGDGRWSALLRHTKQFVPNRFTLQPI